MIAVPAIAVSKTYPHGKWNLLAVYNLAALVVQQGESGQEGQNLQTLTALHK